MKSAAERSIEALTWASVAIWLGFALIAQILSYTWLVVMVLSIILLSSAIYQRSRGWNTGLSIWIFGIWMAVFSVIELVSGMVEAITGTGGLNIGLVVYLGIALISMGVAVALRTVQGSSLVPSQQAGQRAYADDAGSRAPRYIQEDLSSGYIEPQTGQGGSRRGRSRDYGRSGDYTDQPTQRVAQDAGYDQPPQGGRTSTRAAQAPRRGRQQDYAYDQPPAYDQPEDEGYDQPGSYDQPAADRYEEPTQYAPQEGYRSARSTGRRPAERRRPSPQQQSVPRSRSAQAAPPDLESRVEDIIRRSRERRAQPPEDLPY